LRGEVDHGHDTTGFDAGDGQIFGKGCFASTAFLSNYCDCVQVHSYTFKQV
jgi:hypothetical protein